MEHPDGSLYLVAGGSGGSHIFPGVFQIILNLDWGLDAGQAVEHGRVHSQLYPTFVVVDEIYPPELITQLEERGHNITSMENIFLWYSIQSLIMRHLVGEMDRFAAVVNIVTRQLDGKIFGKPKSSACTTLLLICPQNSC